ncbi:MAG: radical SAM protein [Opitutaceae bacterium]|jgi:MoaA/NifB/PqqE/SkfB family radical SAM enzyme
MTTTVQYCIDAVERLPDSEGIHLRGWLLGQSPLHCLVFEQQDGRAHTIFIDQNRPDLQIAFPHILHAQNSGFCAILDIKNSDTQGHLWLGFQSGVWARIPVSFAERTPITIQIQPEQWIHSDALPEAINEAVKRSDDLEEQFRLSFAAGRKLTLRLDLINKCNLRCVFCHYSKDDVFFRPAKNISPEQFKAIYQSLAPLVGDIMLSCADEPLASKNFSEILAYLRNGNPRLVIKFCTNAMLMTALIRRVLVQQQVNQILFSFDGVAKTTLESIRKGSKFERVVGNIFALKHLRDRVGTGRPDFVFNYVMMVQNLHESVAFVNIAKSLGASAIDYRHIVEAYTGFPLSAEQLSNQPARFNYYRERILEEGRRLGVNIYIPPPFSTENTWFPPGNEPVASMADFDAAIQSTSDSLEEAPTSLSKIVSAVPEFLPSETTTNVFCDRPFSEITIRNQNEVLPCPWYQTPLGRLEESAKLSDIFFGTAFSSLRQDMRQHKPGPGCIHCPIVEKKLPTNIHMSDA